KTAPAGFGRRAAVARACHSGRSERAKAGCRTGGGASDAAYGPGCFLFVLGRQLPADEQMLAGGAAVGQHPAGVFGGGGAGRVERLQVIAGQRQLSSFEVVIELIRLLDAQNDAGHGGLVAQPGQGYGRQRSAVGSRHFIQCGQHNCALLLVHGRKLHGGPAAFRLVLAVLAGKVATG
nr:hypothetical protein [Tanacetum cinerariifolium]